MSATFDSAADRLLITTNIPSWDFGGKFTFMVRFYVNGTTDGLQTLFTINRDDLSAYLFLGLLSDLTLYFEASGGAAFSGPTLSTGTWYNLCFTFEVGVASSFYLDDVFIGGTGADAIGVAAERMELGGWRSTNGNRLNGVLSAQNLWLRILGAPEIAAQQPYAEPLDLTDIYNYAFMSTIAFGLDSSSNGYDWTIGGTLDLTANPPGVTFPSVGISIPVAMHHMQQQGFN